ncbi:Uncharacterised protein [Vibrio cholerae]|uniref:Uncharacterized protein n=1 Tax=Vibrio cholerae TaxID=666 RepID=A0A655QG62_VIBCL|nr:Uncharacterised protein [Vibrio cholerae]CSA54625.1 Uncharacterised protein [Vibrio cholerae]CSC00362.1 Uncharacterised protein [Vibrio cholerae]CSC23779.1 Uncharacterised protein [Vibrio cholerae]CSC39251.1 Uncharacterised protein [Vibrio cholerae]
MALKITLQGVLQTLIEALIHTALHRLQHLFEVKWLEDKIACPQFESADGGLKIRESGHKNHIRAVIRIGKRFFPFNP